MVLAICASALLTMGLYLMKRQAEVLPSLDGGWRLGAWLAFAHDGRWVAGVALQVVGYALYLWALRDTPLSVVHTALNGGVALFVVFAVFGLKETPRPLEWLGVTTVSLGLITLGLSTSPTSPTAATGSPGATLFAVGATVTAVLALLLDRHRGHAIGLSVASGMMLGLAGLYAKQLAESASLSDALTSLPFVLTLATNMIGFALMQGALQAGRGIVVVPIFSTLSNLVPIAAGLLVYGEPLPSDPTQAALRLAAIALALGGAAALSRVAKA